LGGLHLDRCERGGGGGLSWVGLAMAFKKTEVFARLFVV
jgi:hypothetical protein